MTINCIFKCEKCKEYVCFDNNTIYENGACIPLNATGLNRLKGHECRCVNANTTIVTTVQATIPATNQTLTNNTNTKTEETLRMIQEHNEVMRKFTPWNYVKPDEKKFCRCSHHVRDHRYFPDGSDEVFCSFAYGNKYYPWISNYKYRHCPCKGFVSYNREEVIRENDPK